MVRSALVYRRFDDAPTRLRRLWVQVRSPAASGGSEASELFGGCARGSSSWGSATTRPWRRSTSPGSRPGSAGRGGQAPGLRDAPIFRSRDVHREAIAALIVFQRAAASEQATQALVEELAAYLRRAANQPGLPFEPPH